MATDSPSEGAETVENVEGSEIDCGVWAEQMKEQANDYYSKKQYKVALGIYNQIIEMCPKEARYYGNRAACYMMLLQYHDALNDAKKCVEIDPKFFKAYSRIIKCSLILGEIVEAETTISKLLELDPLNKTIDAEKKDLEHVRKYLKEADDAYAAKDFRKVVYCMDRCCDVSSSCLKFKLTKAECLMLLGRYQKAQDIAENCIHSDKNNVDAIYILGTVLYYTDKIKMALRYFEYVLKLAPDYSKVLGMYKKVKNLIKKRDDGNKAFKMEQYQEAYNLYTEALSIDPSNGMMNAILHFNKAMAAAKLGRLNESVVECSEALKLNESYEKAFLRRAACYMDLKEYEKAVEDLESACKINKSPYNKRLLYNAKLALKKSKRKDYYEILGIDKNASTDDIRKAYRKRAMVHHPDRHVNASEGEKKVQEEKFKEVGEAYGILSDPKKRSRYDNGHDIEDCDSGFQDIDPTSLFQSYSRRGPGHPFNAGGFASGFSFHFD